MSKYAVSLEKQKEMNFEIILHKLEEETLSTNVSENDSLQRDIQPKQELQLPKDGREMTPREVSEFVMKLRAQEEPKVLITLKNGARRMAGISELPELRELGLLQD